MARFLLYNLYPIQINIKECVILKYIKSKRNNSYIIENESDRADRW